MQVAISNQVLLQHDYWKNNNKQAVNCVWLLLYFVSSLYRYIRSNEGVLLSITFWFQTRGTRKFDESSGGTSAYKG